MTEPGKDVLEDYLCSLLSPEQLSSATVSEEESLSCEQSPNEHEPSKNHLLKGSSQDILVSKNSAKSKLHLNAELTQESKVEPEFELASEQKRKLQNLLAPPLAKPAVAVPLQSKPALEPKTKPKVLSPKAPPVLKDVVEVPFWEPTPEPPSNTVSISEDSLEESSKLKEPAPWCDNGRPVWAQEPFHALLFRVSGLSLAVPLVTLGQIHKLTDKLTPLFGQADWFMGLQETPSGRVQAINTALYVMPERYDASFLGTAKFVISIDGLNWALAVDDVQQPRLLNPDDVTWRGERSKRPWLAGTVKSAMCALLDIPQMGYQLELQQRQSKKHFAKSH